MRALAIARTDARIRFRRFSTVVVFLFLSALAYLWVPNPATGSALMTIDQHRAAYNSAAIGMATAVLGAMFVGLFGFYVVSNAIARDARSRCGEVIAATTVGSGEYLVGKFLGNVLFLSVFIAGFGLVAMAMVVVRGEAPIEPLVFVTQYLLIAPPSIVLVSALAVLFESVPWLSGRFGDVAYFFLFLGLMGFSVVLLAGGAAKWVALFDPVGITSVIAESQRLFHTETMSIGATSFDARLTPVVYPGLRLRADLVGERLLAMLLPLPLLLLARAAFHRFDRVRVKVSAKGGRNWLASLNALLKPLTRWMGGRGLVSADAAMTVSSAPLIVVAIAGVAIAAVAAPPKDVMPIAFAALAVAIADVAYRDQRAGTSALIRSVPRVREQFVWWKTASAGVIAVAFVAVPALRAGVHALVPLLAGTFFVVAAATALGVISGNAKTFIVLFLSFWYLVLNDHGAAPPLDFAGYYGRATPAVAAAYAAIGVGLLAAAQLVYVMRLRRE